MMAMLEVVARTGVLYAKAVRSGRSSPGGLRQSALGGLIWTAFVFGSGVG